MFALAKFKPRLALSGTANPKKAWDLGSRGRMEGWEITGCLGRRLRYMCSHQNSQPNDSLQSCIGRIDLRTKAPSTSYVTKDPTMFQIVTQFPELIRKLFKTYP